MSGIHVRKGEVDRPTILSLAEGRLGAGGVGRCGGCSQIFEKLSSGRSCELQRAKADWVQ